MLLFIGITYVLCFWQYTIHTTSLTYSLKIRRATNIGTAAHHGEPRALTSVTMLPIIYNRERTIITDAQELPTHPHPFVRPPINRKENDFLTGSILNVLYQSTYGWWAELTAGLEYEQLKGCGVPSVKYNRTGLDDMVISVGCDTLNRIEEFIKIKDIQFLCYALGGFPTRLKISECDISNTLVGTRSFAFGLGGEISGVALDTPRHGVIVSIQARFIHFFSHHYVPVLPSNIKIMPGNLIDLLQANQYRYKNNIFEIGYNPTFVVGSGTKIGQARLSGDSFVRHSCYFNVSHLFGNPSVDPKTLLLGAGYSFAWTPTFHTKINNACLVHDKFIPDNALFF